MFKERGHRTEPMPTGGLGKGLKANSKCLRKGLVRIKKNQPWTVDLEGELLRFPFSKHNDQVDALTQYLAGVAENPVPEPLILMAGGNDAKIVRALSRGLWPVAKGDNPLRPRRKGVRRW
jgi:hypothetical protein